MECNCSSNQIIAWSAPSVHAPFEVDGGLCQQVCNWTRAAVPSMRFSAAPLQDLMQSHMKPLGVFALRWKALANCPLLNLFPVSMLVCNSYPRRSREGKIPDPKQRCFKFLKEMETQPNMVLIASLHCGNLDLGEV